MRGKCRKCGRRTYIGRDICYDCNHKEYMEEYRRKNHKKILVNHKIWRDNNKEHWLELVRPANRVRSREIYYYRKTHKLCVGCGKLLKKSKNLKCKKCREKNKLFVTEWKRKKKLRGENGR